MFKKLLFLLLVTGMINPALRAQDTLGLSKNAADSLLDELDAIMDSIDQPKSFFTISAGIGNGFFNYRGSSTASLNTQKNPILTPTLAYFNKSGLGISATAFMVGNQGLTFYQAALTPSYDLIRKNWETGISFTHYFYKDSLPFYSTPLKNEVYSYVSYKALWLEPSLAFNYGWGSSEELVKQQRFVQFLRKRRNGTIDTIRGVITRTDSINESVRDLSVILSAKHDFSWDGVFGAKDGILFSPTIMFNAGTQKYGLNQSSTAAFRSRTGGGTRLPNSNLNLDDNSGFKAQSVSLLLQSEYRTGRFFIQPLVFTDYYLQQSDQRFTFTFSVNVGVDL
jgi:hypothetical protein